MHGLQILLGKSIDYAGLFPPAGLDMEAAVPNYARYRQGPDAWALGRFVLPVGRLSEFTKAVRLLPGSHPSAEPWKLAALSGADLGSELDLVARFNDHADIAWIDTIEFAADSGAAIHDRMHRMPHHLQAYVEIPIRHDPAKLLDAVKELGGRAKVRTGGVTPEAFPTSSDLIRFMSACVRGGIPFKATAGLHHPMRAEYRLTYAPDSPRGVMFGFLNLFVAAAFLRAGMEERRAVQVLEERSPGAFQLEDSGIVWQGERLTPHDLQRARREVIISFGSCSFAEPITELQAMYPVAPGLQQA